jgi:peptide/nickel transport system permease protein
MAWPTRASVPEAAVLGKRIYIEGVYKQPSRVTYLFSRYGMLAAGLVLVGGMSLAAILAPWLAPHDPSLLNVDAILLPPLSPDHLLGTDALGRDVLSRLLWGGRISLWVGFVAVGLSVSIGLVLGLIAGYKGGLTDEIVMRGVDVMLCFPSFFLILAVIAFLEPSLFNIMVVIGLTSWMGVARLVRAETLTLKRRDYVQAARVSGAGPLRILFIHILPNALAPVLVSATLGVAGAILVESSLSFLGLGVQPPTPSWGNMLLEGKEVLEIAPWLSLSLIHI